MIIKEQFRKQIEGGSVIMRQQKQEAAGTGFVNEVAFRGRSRLLPS